MGRTGPVRPNRALGRRLWTLAPSVCTVADSAVIQIFALSRLFPRAVTLVAMEQPVQKGTPEDRALAIALLVLACLLSTLPRVLRHIHLPLVYVVGTPILLCSLATLMPDKHLARDKRIRWRIVVVLVGIFYSALIFQLVVWGRY